MKRIATLLIITLAVFFFSAEKATAQIFPCDTVVVDSNGVDFGGYFYTWSDIGFPNANVPAGDYCAEDLFTLLLSSYGYYGYYPGYGGNGGGNGYTCDTVTVDSLGLDYLGTFYTWADFGFPNANVPAGDYCINDLFIILFSNYGYYYGGGGYVCDSVYADNYGITYSDGSFESWVDMGYPNVSNVTAGYYCYDDIYWQICLNYWGYGYGGYGYYPGYDACDTVTVDTAGVDFCGYYYTWVDLGFPNANVPAGTYSTEDLFTLLFQNYGYYYYYGGGGYYGYTPCDTVVVDTAGVDYCGYYYTWADFGFPNANVPAGTYSTEDLFILLFQNYYYGYYGYYYYGGGYPTTGDCDTIFADNYGITADGNFYDWTYFGINTTVSITPGEYCAEDLFLALFMGTLDSTVTPLDSSGLWTGGNGPGSISGFLNVVFDGGAVQLQEGEIHIHDANMQLLGYVMADEYGYFEITGLPLGDIHLTAALGDFDFAIFTYNLSANSPTVTDAEIVNTLVLNNDEFDLDATINVYPNPTVDFVNVNLGDNFTNATITVVAMDGKIIQSIQVDESIENINLQDYEIGLYNILIQTENNLVSKSVMKTN